MSMHCQQVGNRIEITPSLNPFEVKRNNQFIRSLDDPKYHGFDTPRRILWSVLDTPETRTALRYRGCCVVSSDRNCTDMSADLDRLMELI
jgi:hypothetical protein